MNGAGDPSADIFMVAVIVLYWVLLGNWIGTQSRQDDDKAEHKDARAEEGSGSVETTAIPSVPVGIIREIDRNFNAAAFLADTQAAYEAVLRAYAEGDIGTLKRFVGPDVFNTFGRAIQDRRERQQTLHLTFIGMRKAEIANAVKKGGFIEAGVRFIADVVTATRSADGMIVAGDAQQIVEVADAWTFAAEIGARNLDWKLVATDSF